MKQFWEISARKVALGFSCWLIATDLLVWLAHSTEWWPSKLLLFVSISLLPGATLLRSMRIVLRALTAVVLYSFGLSVLVLMISGLVANQVLPLFGVSRPLEPWGALGAWNVVTVLLIIVSMFANLQAIRLRKQYTKGASGYAWLLGALSLILPGLAAFGAFRLNNGGDSLFAELTLYYGAILIGYVLLLRRHLPDGLLTWFIFVLGLTILLMTSLRGWDIVGHDIEQEFRVYTLTHIHAHWNVGLWRDPYNACLSITILPEMLTRILNVSGVMVFKVVLQIIFAACPVVIYVLLRQYVSKLGALVGALLFICYPTFINDSTMLTRQGVAYLFFALALLVISNRAQRKRYKLLFFLCAMGAVLSHYSTAYMFVALFAVAVGCKICLTWWQRRRRWTLPSRTEPTVLSVLFAGLLFLMTFIWYSQLTATSGGLAVTLRASVANIPKLFSADSKSSDTSAALLFAGGKTQTTLYQAYLARTQLSTVPDQTAAAFTPTLTSDDLPLTKLGKQAITHGIDPAGIAALRQNFAKVLQVLALAGVLYAIYRLLWRKPGALDSDFICLSMAGLVLLVLMVLLPVLSINYGILRAFQQALIFLLLPITLLLIRVGRRLPAWARSTTATTSIIALFLLFTGIFAHALGGTSPTLSLDNHGFYFGLYYSSEADERSFVWLKEHIPRGNDVRAANFNRAFMHDPNYPFSNAGILPSQISPASYVYLDYSQVRLQKFYTNYESDPLIVTFPLDYYDATRNEIYSTASTRVYR